MVRVRVLVAIAACVAAVPALAQTTAPAPAGSAGVIPEKQSVTPLQGGQSESLSSKLSKTGGVITPSTNVDPGIAATAPDPQPNTTPVIPPNATGGTAK